ncbi:PLASMODESMATA CALLOSE-BINDING PROTEIN 5 [Cajanus cajan]|uniref:Glucan endo-1,3-beta-glucosidase-like protein 1 n=1 Tax=Cajanus cajan TaxID=3821 RepID=A0A151SES4_CAJCA|nr:PLASMODESMATA CALLOSE-BINDING PROTEIN 5 [Cajanus cajan]KYP53332.1 Glucan endo-1,3-beta-glucosidase-like protein 1 [Cajanus cajan]
MPITTALALFLLLLGFAGGDAPSREVWCAAKNNAEDASLQAAVQWACGAGGADCGAIQEGGPCYDPSNVQNTASYAFNDYFRKHTISEDNCNFDNNAAITSFNPSYGNCRLPSSSLVNNGSFSGSESSMGLMPGADTSGCGEVVLRWWFWPFIVTTHFLSIVSVSRVVFG